MIRCEEQIVYISIITSWLLVEKQEVYPQKKCSFFFINTILTTNANVFNIILTMLSTCLPVQKEVGALNVEFCTSEYQGKPYVPYSKRGKI